MNTEKLTGMAVVSLSEGAKLGQVDAPLFDPITLQLRALRVRGDGQTFIIPLELVQTVGADAVMVEGSEATQTATKGGEYGNLVEFSALKQLKVVDDAGTFVGTLHAIDLDPATGHAVRIVVHKGGVLGIGAASTTFAAAEMRSVGRDIITVSKSVAAPAG